MTEKLTDAELLEAWHSVSGVLPALRAVQDAVLAKWEVETREREREAWDARAQWNGGDDRSSRTARDRIYPSLKPPASVTLSTGTYRLCDRTWVRDAEKNASVLGHGWGPDVQSQADADALKSYLQAMEGK